MYVMLWTLKKNIFQSKNRSASQFVAASNLAGPVLGIGAEASTIQLHPCHWDPQPVGKPHSTLVRT